VRVSRRFKLRPGSSAIPPLRLSERLIMASRRLSRLQRHILKCLMAELSLYKLGRTDFYTLFRTRIRFATPLM
jgi:hypothetical protein